MIHGKSQNIAIINYGGGKVLIMPYKPKDAGLPHTISLCGSPNGLLSDVLLLNPGHASIGEVDRKDVVAFLGHIDFFKELFGVIGGIFYFLLFDVIFRFASIIAIALSSINSK